MQYWGPSVLTLYGLCIQRVLFPQGRRDVALTIVLNVCVLACMLMSPCAYHPSLWPGSVWLPLAILPGIRPDFPRCISSFVRCGYVVP